MKLVRVVLVVVVAAVAAAAALLLARRQPPRAHHLEFASQPREAVAGDELRVEVVLADERGVQIPRDEPSATLVLESGGALRGTTSRPVVSGRASFSGIVVDAAGQKRLRARCGDLETASLPFTIHPKPVELRFERVPEAWIDKLPLGIAVALLDERGERVRRGFHEVSLAISCGDELVGTEKRPIKGEGAVGFDLDLARPGSFSLVACCRGLEARAAIDVRSSNLLPVAPLPRARASTKRDLSYDAALGDKGTFDLHAPEGGGNGRALVAIHGGAWQIGDKAWCDGFVDRLVAAGFVVLSPNYRLAPAHRWPAQLEDCQAAVRHFRAHARELGFDEARLGAFGCSAGGHLATMLAFRDDARALPGRERIRVAVDVAGDADLSRPAFGDQQAGLARVLGDATPERIRDLSSVTFARADVSLLIVHAIEDELVNVDQSDELFRALCRVRAKDVFYRRLPRKGHEELLQGDDVLFDLIEFFRGRL